jgi:hypothetical protein
MPRTLTGFSLRYVLWSIEQPLVRHNRAWRAFAVAYPALSSHFDFQNSITTAALLHDGHVPVLQVLGFVWSQAGVAQEENVIVQLGVRAIILLRIDWLSGLIGALLW